MTAIIILSLRRLWEPASVMLFFLGCVVAYIVADSPFFDLVNMQSNEGKSGALLGTVLLVGLSVLVTVFNAASDIPRDITSRFIAVLLSKPLSRFEYLTGKYVGTLAIGLINCSSWITIQLITRSEELTAQVIFDQYMVQLIFIPATALAVMVSCFLQDIVSMVVTFVILIASVINGMLPVVLSLSPQYLHKFILTIYYIFPNFLYFMQSYDTIWGICSIFLYSFSLGAVFLYFAQYIFDSGDVF